MWSGAGRYGGAIGCWPTHHRGSRSGFATKWEAKYYADACEVAERAAAAAAEEPGAAGERVVTVGEWWDRWFPAQDLAPATLETYAQQYRHHIAPRFAEVPVGQVTGLDLAGFSRDLRGRGLSRSSVTVVMSVLRDLLGDAAAEGVIAAAPNMPGRGRTRHTPVSVRPGRVLELETLLRVCARLPEQYALMVVVGAFTGMRWGEVCAMRRAFLHLPPSGAAGGAAWYEVDAKVGAVHEDVHAHRYFAPPKGGSGRVVDLPPFLAELLARHIDAAGGRELLFVNRLEEPIRHSDWLHIWHAACGESADDAADGLLPGARYHDLRHTHSTMLDDLRVPDALCDDRLGHHQAGVRRIYKHATPDMRAAMLAELEARWTQVAARAGVDVERLFADRGGVRLEQQVRQGRGRPARAVGGGRAPDDVLHAAQDPGDLGRAAWRSAHANLLPTALGISIAAWSLGASTWRDRENAQASEPASPRAVVRRRYA